MKYKKGDRVKCVPGYQTEDNQVDNYGGAGYQSNMVFVIRGWHHNVLWPEGNKPGVYDFAVTLMDPIMINRNIKKLEFI